MRIFLIKFDLNEEDMWYDRYFGEIPHSKPPCYERVGCYADSVTDAL